MFIVSTCDFEIDNTFTTPTFRECDYHEYQINDNHHTAYNNSDIFTVTPTIDTTKDIVSRLNKNNKGCMDIISEEWKVSPITVVDKVVSIFTPSPKSKETKKNVIESITYSPIEDDEKLLNEAINNDNKDGHFITYNTHNLTEDEKKIYRIICTYLKERCDNHFVKAAEILRTFVYIECRVFEDETTIVNIYVDKDKIKHMDNYPLYDIQNELYKKGYNVVKYRLYKRPSIVDFYRDHYR